MNKTLFKTIKKNKQITAELRRAHLMVALLSIGISMMVTINYMAYDVINIYMTVSLVVLSTIIAATSLGVVVGLSLKRK